MKLFYEFMIMFFAVCERVFSVLVHSLSASNFHESSALIKLIYASLTLKVLARPTVQYTITVRYTSTKIIK